MSRHIATAIPVGVAGAIFGVVWVAVPWGWVLKLLCGIVAVVLGSVIVFALWLERFTRNYGPPRV